jgi:hypothetical protein
MAVEAIKIPNVRRSILVLDGMEPYQEEEQAAVEITLRIDYASSMSPISSSLSRAGLSFAFCVAAAAPAQMMMPPPAPMLEIPPTTTG